MKQALIYSLKVWLTTIFVGPLLYVMPFAFFFHPFHDIQTIAIYTLLFVPVVIVGSLPLLLILFLLIQRLTRKEVKNIMKKISILIFILTTAPYTLIFFMPNNRITLEDITLVFSFAIVGIGSVWFYKLKPVKKEVSL